MASTQYDYVALFQKKIAPSFSPDDVMGVKTVGRTAYFTSASFFSKSGAQLFPRGYLTGSTPLLLMGLLFRHEYG